MCGVIQLDATIIHLLTMCPLPADYRLLEDTGRFAGGATRDKLIQIPRSTARVSL